MKRNKLKIFAILSMTLVMLFSCSDYLDLKPEGSIIQSEFWKNKEQVASAVAGCYASMNQSGFSDKVLFWGELRAEMMISVKANSDAQNMMKNYIIPTNGLLNWKDFYATINYCNLVLEFSDGAQANDLTFSKQELERYKAEALTIRSLAYFILVKNFKEVPLVVTATSTNQVDFYPAKSSEADIIKRITEDLNAAIPNLNTSYAELAYDKGRMTKGAALSILADVYLWNNQYDECIATTQSITDLGKYSLVEGSNWFKSIFFEGNSKEGIFELQFTVTNKTYNSAFYVTNPTYAPYKDISLLYGQFPDDVRGNMATYDNGNSVFKFAGVNETGVYRSSNQFFNNMIFYRYADVLLMQAEGYLLSTDKQDIEKAYNLINQVHSRAIGKSLDVNHDQASLLTALLLERQKEFAFEGKRWYDLLRFARRNNFENQSLILGLAETKAGADNYDQILSYYTNKESYFLPIYQNELNLNKNLVQNPYYKN